MQVGIIGLPNAGKSTLFNAVTNAGATTETYPFTTIEPNTGMVEVPDKRLAKVMEMVGSGQAVPASIRFKDVAGLVKGASKGEGLGNQFLGHIRDADVLVHVVRCFQAADIAHIAGRIEPGSDIDTVNLELMLADLEIIDRRLKDLNRHAKAPEKNILAMQQLLKNVQDTLNKAVSPKQLDLTSAEKDMLAELKLLTMKPVIYVANIGEEDINRKDNLLVEEIEQRALKENALTIALPAELEEEIAELDKDEADEFLKSMGLSESPLDQLVHTVFRLLDLISFFTANPNEAHAWNIQRGTIAHKAAGKVHSDMERGFIKAEVISFDDLADAGSIHSAKEKGHFRIEGKDYVVQDGDVILFRFSV